MYQKTMLKIILSLVNWKTLQNVHFCITIMASKSMKDSEVLKMSVPEQRLTSSKRHLITFISMHVNLLLIRR